VNFSVAFPRVSYRVEFVATVPSATLGWSIRFASFTQSPEGSDANFSAPNGTYTFDVSVPMGFLVTPSHGFVTVDGSASVISLVVSSYLPSVPPPIWSLVVPAVEVGATILASAAIAYIVVARATRPSPVE